MTLVKGSRKKNKSSSTNGRAIKEKNFLFHFVAI